MNIRTKLLFAALVGRICFGQNADDNPMAIVQRAYQLQQSGDYAGAADAYKAFLKLRPEEVGAHSNLGVVLTKLGRYHEAIQEYEAAQKLLPGDTRIGLNLALAYEKSGQLEEAAKRLKLLHEAQPQEQQITLLLSDAYLQAGENDRVIDLLQPLEQQNPDDLAVAYVLGTAFIRQRRVNEGQVLLDKILKKGDTAEARFLLGMQMFQSGDYPASVKQFAAAAIANPNLPELQTYYGQALLTTGDADGAAAAFHRALEQTSNDYGANLGLGQILTVRSRFVEAKAVLQQALLTRPQSGEAQLALGTCLSRLGEPKEARDLFLSAIKAMPNSAEAHQELANVDARLQFTKEASAEKLIASRLRAAAEARSALPGPHQDQLAPEFSLPDAVTGKPVSLAGLRAKSPVVLIFGSYTCPNFRSSAEALKTLQTKYGARAPFFLVYIREAHAAGNWQSTRNEREGVELPPAESLVDKQNHAAMCSRSLHLPFPALVDGLDNKVETAYGAWPSRAFVIGQDGRVRYSSRLTELDFSPAEMDKALSDSLRK